LTSAMLEELKEICKKQIKMKEGTLIEFNGETDHLPLLFARP